MSNRPRLCTRIVNDDGVRLETVEHIMAAFAGLGIDNATVRIDSGEAPILDGGSLPVVEAINRVGIRTLSTRRRTIVVTAPIVVEHAGGWARIDPSDMLEIDAEINFDDPAIGRQRFVYKHGDSQFGQSWHQPAPSARCATFAAMQNAGLALGGSLNNAVVVEDGRILNDGGLRMEGEFVRHKILDCLGDLYLLGTMVRGRPRHALVMPCAPS